MTVKVSADISSKSVLKDLYVSALRIRLTEEEISKRYSQNKMRCPTHLSIGQEGVAAAVGLVLGKEDFAVSTHRAHAHYLGKGGDLKAMIAEIYGKKTGCSGGHGGSMHLSDLSCGFIGSTSIVGNSIPVGVGLGLSIQLNRTNQVSCVFFGDGSVEEGAFYEAANFAAVRKLPVLFICENNFFSVYSPLSVRQPSERKIHELVKAIGVNSDVGDGNDTLGVYHSVSKTVADMRNGSGPFFWEFYTYRHFEHCGPNLDDNLGYRPVKEVKAWLDRDPVLKLQEDLLASGTEMNELKEIKILVSKEIDEAFDFAENSEFPNMAESYRSEYK
ncbi:putative TPP-dependent acetoin dehydrogenase complex, E1 component, alpha subunit [Leptospira inadai serovar Lyme str. 10]|uniref:Acetoin dehydrogenase n=2 Tax=Leptospira inadai serovar Lyme TaxID=293084 RepID=A0ABX4YMJ6_9LEPT|nr:thiamine pyrophosphate-dependent dehydrogenase E1 component subunit alpha [Leptospira inadai]EQA36789.1 putative TPP-dependent acetoin dehydrogenase complex, E1 component, alpha subunit [Leptospira inadai serovar Lyme str. 10]PNV76496.1 acetoin dehydrogenase [Leptospira inadai serovar Lyme]